MSENNNGEQDVNVAEQSPKKKRKIPNWVIWVVGIVVVSTWIFGGDDEEVGNSGANDNNNNEAVEASENVTGEDAFDPDELSIDEWVRYIVEDEVGETTNEDEPRITDLRVNEDMSGDHDGKYIALVTMDYGMSMTANMARRGMWSDSKDIMQRLFERDDFSEVVLFWEVPLTNQYGNTRYGNIMKVMISEETSEKINWEQFDQSNFPNVADDYFQHPTLSN